MKRKYILLCAIALALGSLRSFAQDITGKWVGYFDEQNFDEHNKQVSLRYEYEVDVTKDKAGHYTCTTYTKYEKAFYGKAAATISYDKSKHTWVLEEKKMQETTIKPSDGTVACLMTDMLSFTSNQYYDSMKGPFKSISADKKDTCVSGKVYLMKMKAVKP